MSDKISRSAAVRLLGDVIAQAAVDQDQGLSAWSKKLRDLVDRTLVAMGVEPPNRVSLDGLIELFEDIETPSIGDAHRYPIAFRTPAGVLLRFVTVEREAVAFGEEKYTAVVVSLHEE